jgi:formylglycine-generating enzyme required for sulfatase activity
MTTAPVVPTRPSPDATGASGTAKTSGLAIASLVAGFFGLCTAGLGGIAGLILGIIALKKIGRSSGALGGRGLAIAGLIVSVCTLLLWVLAVGVSGVLYLWHSGEMKNRIEMEKREMSAETASRTGAPEPVRLDVSQLQRDASSRYGVPLTTEFDVGRGVTMKMIVIPPGKFMCGEGENRHEVTISKPFLMGVTEVTQEQYQAVMGTNPSWFKGATNPVDGVSWNDATQFCKKLSEKTHQIVRLPTDAEWEYACRAGAQTAYSFGDDPSELGDYAWTYSNSGGTTHPVGQKKPNAWGLYDMHGNVWEWCADWFGEDPKGPVTDPSGPATGTLRVQRGGSVGNPDDDVFECAVRAGNSPESRLSDNGFRCAMTIP